MPSTERILADLVQRVERQFYGKFRGLVVDNADPERLGRLRVRVPSVLGRDVVTGWALPCAPYGGDAGQGLLFVPEIGSGVWIEFEEGDLEFPIWVGTYWSGPGHDSEVPRPNRADGAEEPAVQVRPTRKIVKTVKGHTLQFEDADGVEMVTIVEAAHGHVITLDARGIRVTDGTFGHEIALDADGVAVVDGLHHGNAVTMDATGVTIADGNGNEVVLGPSGVQVGSGEAVESLVHGTSLAANVAGFLASLNTHVHIGNLGAPTSPPVTPLSLQVPLSRRHRVE
ncbi:MAG TPA: phage baseplate assembly protein V [Solirubrobacteraceae bacterium]|nr:phage baseplate assembly protein V [Solirubrobacteraceae bacterium]